MVSDSLRVPIQTSGQVRSLMKERHTDSGKPEVILTFMESHYDISYSVFLVCNYIINIIREISATSLAHSPVPIGSI